MDITTARVWTDRLSWYVTKAGTAASLLVYFKLYGWSWWYLVIIFAIPIIVWVEKRYIIPGEQGYYTRKNPELSGMIKKIDGLYTQTHHDNLNDAAS